MIQTRTIDTACVFVAALLALTSITGIAAADQATDADAERTEAPADAATDDAAAGPGFDAALAEKLGADDYGMRRYVLAFLKAGPNRDRTQEEANELQAAHMANIGRLAEMGKLALAGPFLDGGELRGIYIFAVESIEEAEELTNSDPAIQAGSLVMELHPWYGSAALMQVNETHGSIARTTF